MEQRSRQIFDWSHSSSFPCSNRCQHRSPGKEKQLELINKLASNFLRQEIYLYLPSLPLSLSSLLLFPIAWIKTNEYKIPKLTFEAKLIESQLELLKPYASTRIEWTKWELKHAELIGPTDFILLTCIREQTEEHLTPVYTYTSIHDAC